MVRKFPQINLIFSIVFLMAQEPANHQIIYQSVSGAINPQLSPDGHYLSFTSPNYAGLYLLNMVDKSVIEITDEFAAGFGYGWSPSGSSIAYKPALFLEKRRYNSLVIYNIETGGKIFAISEKTKLPGKIRWIDGNKIILSGNIGESAIHELSRKNLSQQEYYNFEKNTIYLLREKASTKTVFFTNKKEIHDLVVSPQKTHILFEEYGGNLIILNVENHSTINLGIGHETEWSPDGNIIVFMRTSDDGHTITQSDIYIVNSDGTNLTNLTKGINLIAMRPTWVDNTHIIYDTDANNTLYMVDVQR